MKLLFAPALLFGFLASCSSSSSQSGPAANLSTERKAHHAISDYLKKDMDDPSSYQPAEWGKPTVWTLAQEAHEEEQLVHVLAELTHTEGKRVQSDSLTKIDSKLKNISDTTRVGLLIKHRFRAKNKMGALVLDSATLLVSPDNKVPTYGEVIQPGLLKLARKL